MGENRLFKATRPPLLSYCHSRFPRPRRHHWTHWSHSHTVVVIVAAASQRCHLLSAGGGGQSSPIFIIVNGFMQVEELLVDSPARQFWQSQAAEQALEAP